jgi:hypothetical protein
LKGHIVTQQLGPRQLSLIEALESGKYAQGRGFLTQLIEGREYHCCLGVACKENNVPRVLETAVGLERYFKYEDVAHSGEDHYRAGYLPDNIRDFYAFRSNAGSSLHGGGESLTTLNDKGKSLKDIAAILRKDPEEYFEEPR